MFMSMTGFNRGQAQTSWGVLSLEISSINHRYQEIYVKLPRELAGWEHWFHQRLRKYFRRGKLQVRVEVLFAPSLKTERINRDILEAYYAELAEAGRSLGQSREPVLENLLTLPGVLEQPKFCGDDEEGLLGDAFARLIDDTAAGWLKMRACEGEHLREEIFSHLSKLEKLTSEIEEMWLDAKESAFQTTRGRIVETLKGLGEKLDEGRYLQEIVILSDKWDISEELARLKSHIAKFRMAGEEKEPSGRKLDFIVQEMNREVNTLDSKIASADIRWLAVEAKAALERIREQIQNLE